MIKPVKLIQLIIGASILLTTSFTFANLAPECVSTWDQSSAANSCGQVCTNSINVQSYPFSSSYDKAKNTCTFSAGCCEGMPFQICSYSDAVCDLSTITVEKGDFNFSNNHGKLVHQ